MNWKTALRTLGVRPGVGLRAARSLSWFLDDLREFKRQSAAISSDLPWGPLSPSLDDKGQPGGTASGHYFHQDLLVARRIFARNPERHIDVGSRVDGFVAHVASFRNIEVIDIRPSLATVPNVTFTTGDLTALPDSLRGVADSVSCLHALEHFGLGRYGDPIDPSGHLKGIAGLRELLRPGGTLYLSVPIGPSRVEFNSQRVFSVPYMLEKLASSFEVLAFSYVDDGGALHENVALDESAGTSYGCKYGCGIFELRHSGGT